jgi:serine/threonine-protein kinase
VARALDAAHASGIVHRDLKPENIFLAFDEDGGIFPKLLDFGIAKLMSPPDSGGGTDLTQGGGSYQGAKTRTGTPMGTPYYMSPEQCRGRNVDHRTDIYSFGVLTHRMLTGVLPFDGEDVVDLLLKQATQPPPRMSSVLPTLSPLLDTPVLQMMEKDPSNRPASLVSAVDSLVQAAQLAGLGAPGAVSVRHVPPPPTSGKVHDHSTAMAATLIPGSEPSPPAQAGAGHNKLIAAGIAALGLVVAVGAVVMMKGASAGPLPANERASSLAASVAPSAASVAASATSPASAAVPTVVPLPTASARVADEVELTIAEAPAGAQVYLGAAKLGEAPGPLRIRRGESPLQLVIKANGYRPKSIEFIPMASGTIEAKLSKIAKAGPAVNGDLEKPY